MTLDGLTSVSFSVNKGAGEGLAPEPRALGGYDAASVEELVPVTTRRSRCAVWTETCRQQRLPPLCSPR